MFYRSWCRNKKGKVNKMVVNSIPRKGKKWMNFYFVARIGEKSLDIMSFLPILLYAGYSVKLKYICISIQVYYSLIYNKTINWSLSVHGNQFFWTYLVEPKTMVFHYFICVYMHTKLKNSSTDLNAVLTVLFGKLSFLLRII